MRNVLFCTTPFITLVLFGCVQNQIQPSTSLLVYIEPKAGEPSATFLASTSTFLFQKDVTRVESVDEMTVPVDEDNKVSAIIIKAGERSIVLVRETGFNTGKARASLSFFVLPGHRYIVHAEEKSNIINIGTKFWVEDSSAGGVHVAEGEGWGATHGPFVHEK